DFQTASLGVAAKAMRIDLIKWLIQFKTRKLEKDWGKVKSPSLEQIISYKDLPTLLKLNGGLGTTMGYVGPKSVIEVRDNMTFLDLSVRQIEYLNSKYDVNVPFILMNSFNTDGETQQNSKIWKSPNSDIRILDQLIAEGKEYIFVSNVDNLGTVANLEILQYLVDSEVEFLMEVTDKTKADIKGGTLIDYEGKFRLLEIAQVPAKHMEEFKSIKKFRIFNTNNLWINLKAIKWITKEKGLGLEVISNKKTLDSDEKVIQLKTALAMNPKCLFQTVPLVKLGDGFKKVSNFLARFQSLPHILELDHLTVTGDVTFGSNVKLKGTVIIFANHGAHIDIPSNAVLENKVVSGNLRILDL
ncbi:14188_t:CDS:2, partial [Entrophospora sp. SA101]